MENSSKLPFYRTRLFWGVVVSLSFLWSLYVYLSFLKTTDNGVARIVGDLSFSLGSTYFFIIAGKLGGSILAWLSAIAYHAIQVLLLYKTFYRERVRVLFPSIFLLLLLSGTLIAILVSGI